MWFWIERHRIGWRWLQVETHAALLRRKATNDQFLVWRDFMDAFSWIDLSTSALPGLMQTNEKWGLRSADAGHVYLFQEFHRDNSRTRLVTFDREMRELAENLGWPVWQG